MLRLYIPTTTLNFNNILSTESISPKSFYGTRGFGYSRWFTVPENNLDNVLVLYRDKIKVHNTNPDLEDHPLIIETTIDKDEVKEVSDGVYVCDHTIYLNPWATYFYFDSQGNKRIALSLSDSSLETKLMRLYGKRLNVGDFSCYKDAERINAPVVALNESAVKHDFVLNKLKGLLYGYYIGALLSVNLVSLKKINNLREIKNILSSVITVDGIQLTALQETRLRGLIKEHNSYIPIAVELTDRFGEKNCEEIIAVLSKYLDVPGLWSFEKIYSSLNLTSYDGSNKALGAIDDEMIRQETDIASRSVKLDPSEVEILCGEGKFQSLKITIGIPEPLLHEWLNVTLMSDYVDKNISTYKKKLSDDLTFKAKDVLGEEWTTSHIRSFLNKLRKHLGGESFDVEWGNNALSAIAAVLISGDDWHKLLQFLRARGLTDYRIPFALYGEIVGFANLTRDFTDNILNTDSGYLVGVYKEFHGQLHGVEINTESNSVITNPTSAINTTKKVVESVTYTSETPTTLSTVPTHNNTLEEWRQSIRRFLHGLKNVKKKDSLFEALERAFVEFGDKTDYVGFFALLNDYSEWKTKTGPSSTWQKMMEHFCDEEYNKRFNLPLKQKKENKTKYKKESSQILENDLFISPTSPNFVDDRNASAFLNTCGYIPQDMRSVLIEKLIKFQKDYAPDGYYYGRDDSPRTNDNTIKHFINKCTYKKDGRKPWVEDTSANREILGRLKSDLIDRYRLR